MTDNQQPDIEASPKPSGRPTIQMTGNEAISAQPPTDPDEDSTPTAGENQSTDSETSTVGESESLDSIWTSPALDSLPAPEDSDEIIDLSVNQQDVDDLTQPGSPTAFDIDTTILVARQWGTENDVTGDPYLTELIADLSSRKRLTYWASINPLDHLPHPEPKAGRALKQVARVIILLRNVGVFVPVALTWLAINKATDAFGKYADTLSDQEVNFLQFWQSGGPDGAFLDRFWRIQHVAFLDAMIIAFIILATLLSGAIEAQAARRNETRQINLDASRTKLALTIGRALHGNRSASPESISEALALALTDLSEAARNVATATSRLESSTSAIDSLKPRLESLNQQIASLNRNFATDVVNSVANLSSSVGTLGSTLGGDMNRFLSEVLSGIEEINESFKKTSVTVEFGTKQLRDDLEAIHTRLAQVAGRRP